MKELMTALEVAELLGVSRGRVYEWVKEKKLKSLKLKSGGRRFRKEAVREFMGEVTED